MRLFSNTGRPIRFLAAAVAVVVTGTLLAVGLNATPAEAAVANRAYVVNSDAGNVSVLDATNHNVVATVAVGTDPSGIAVNPAGTRVYVTNRADGTVSVIDAVTETVVATVGVGQGPFGAAVNQSGSRVYTANLSGSVSVIDAASNTVVSTIPVFFSPVGVAVNPAGTRVYVTNNDTGTVTVIDAIANVVLGTISVGAGPIAVALDPAGARAYVTNTAADTVSVIDLAAGTVVATIPVGDGPFWAAANPAGGNVYVANSGDETVSVIDAATLTVVNTFPSPGGATGVALRPDGGVVYVTNDSLDRVAVHLPGGIPITSSPTGGRPTAVAFGPAAAQSADIDVDLTARAGPLLPGFIAYTMTARSLGTDPVTAATVTATLPNGAGASQVSAGCAAAGNKVTCNFGSIPVGGSAIGTFRIPISLLSLGQVTVTAARTGSTPADPNAANDTASAGCTVVSILLAFC